MKIASMTHDLIGDEAKIPQDEDIRVAIKFFKGFGYDPLSQTFKDIESPVEIMNRVKAANKALMELKTQSEQLRPDLPESYRFDPKLDLLQREPMVTFPSVIKGVKKAGREKFFKAFETVEPEGTKVEIGPMPAMPEERQFPIKQLPYYPEQDEQKSFDVPMRDQSMREWMFNK
jgi:hypothetical protein